MGVNGLSALSLLAGRTAHQIIDGAQCRVERVGKYCPKICRTACKQLGDECQS